MTKIKTCPKCLRKPKKLSDNGWHGSKHLECCIKACASEFDNERITNWNKAVQEFDNLQALIV